jgi:predicted Na+-dependent transporter
MSLSLILAIAALIVALIGYTTPRVTAWLTAAVMLLALAIIFLSIGIRLPH